MKYIITADIRGVKYYLKVGNQLDSPRTPYDFVYKGLKSHASKYSRREVAEAVIAGIKSDWELKVEAVQ